jgi:hypothetical protein
MPRSSSVPPKQSQVEASSDASTQWESEDDERDFKPLTAEEAAQWRKTQRKFSVWELVGLQALMGSVAAVFAWVLMGRAEVAWSVAYVQQIATRLGFVPASVAGRWVLPAAEEHAPPVLQLSVDAQAALAALDNTAGASQASAVREAVLVLDAAPSLAWPCRAPPAQPNRAETMRPFRFPAS